MVPITLPISITQFHLLITEICLHSPSDDPRLAKIRSDRGYTYTDVINVCPDKLPNFEDKIKSFFKEHIHYGKIKTELLIQLFLGVLLLNLICQINADEEIRYCMDGSGYFDIRDKSDLWIRISLQRGDLIVLPEGIYHRFTCDSTDYIQAMRLFVGEPIWTPYNRSEIDEKKDASRLKYVATFF